MSEWITDRLPTVEDAPEDWVFVMNHGNVQLYLAVWVTLGMPWHPIVPPDPYVKPKRWTVEWNDVLPDWCLYENGYHRVMLQLYNPEYREAAQKIADAYNEVMP
jgi:hypothetical protein